jgi:hypothetical protein
MRRHLRTHDAGDYAEEAPDVELMPTAPMPAAPPWNAAAAAPTRPPLNTPSAAGPGPSTLERQVDSREDRL